MKIFITKKLQLHYEGIILGRKTSEPGFEEKVEIDPFVGCMLSIPEEYDQAQYEAVKDGLIGTVLSIRDDAYRNDKGVYLPGELDLL